MKRFIALLLVAVMALSLFAACGETNTPPASNPPAQDPAPSQGGEENKDPVDPLTGWIFEDDLNMSGEVNFWIPFKGSQGMDAMIAEFNKSYPNIKVKLNPYNNNSDGNMAVNTAILAGEVDVLASFGLSNTYNRWANDLFIDITDKVAEEGIDLMTNWGYDCYTYEDSIYTFPCGGQCTYVAINMTAWEEAGLGELPTEWTWDEYMEACRKMTKLNDDGTVAVYGGSDYHSTNYFLFPYVQVNGGDMYYNADGSASAYSDPLALKGLQRELKAELEEKIWYPKYSYRSDNIQAQMTFCQGITASTIIGNVTRFLSDTETYPDVNWITGFAPYPVEEKGQTNYVAGVTPFSHAGIATNCQDEAAAWAFVKWYASYGVKYLSAAGHAPGWKGTDTSNLVEVVFGSEEEAKKWIDVDSYLNVFARSDLPAYAEVTLTAYSDVSGAHKDPFMQAIAGEMSAEDCLKQAAEEADQAISDAK